MRTSPDAPEACIDPGLTLAVAVRRPVAAGAVKVMRHGLDSGHAEEIERLPPRVGRHPGEAEVRSSTDARLSRRP